MEELIEIIKIKISSYQYRLKLIKKLLEKRSELYYDLANVKAISYDKQPGSYNKYAIEHKRLKLSAKIEEYDRQIEEQYQEIINIEKILKKIDRENEKKEVGEELIKPSEIIISVLCKLNTYEEIKKKYLFTSTSKIMPYINKKIEKIIE